MIINENCESCKALAEKLKEYDEVFEGQAEKYKQALQKIEKLLKKSMGKINANTHFSLVEEAIKKCNVC